MFTRRIVHAMTKKTRADIVCAVIDACETAVTEVELHAAMYLIDTALATRDTVSLQPQYQYTKSVHGVTANQLKTDVHDLVQNDILYQEHRDNESVQQVFTVDYRSQFESRVASVSSEYRELIQRVCGEYETTDAMLRAVQELPRVKNAEKHELLDFR